jgi:hypothetical protein
MPPKNNPLGLNGLQLRTLALFQIMAADEQLARPADDPGHVLIGRIPRPHGDHFHLGGHVVAARDASGLANEAAWMALERKGLIKSMFPAACILTPIGLSYDTGVRDMLLHPSHH